MITAQRVRELLAYDPLTGVFVRKHRPRSDFNSENAYATWNAKYAGQEAGNSDEDGYLGFSIDGQRYRAHRLAWLYVYGEWPKKIDHDDGVRANNRILNLNDVTVSQNNRNRGVRSDNTSGVPGVYKRGDRWQASIRCDGKSRSLGRFDTVEQAAAARKAADREYGFNPNHGRTARPARSPAEQEMR